ncbi:MAG: phytanoyl-CoA dioxygenase family protein [Gammaproteobacteria bacterium]|nr:phytanoyl-CoA dioxygenase family protein [Gammaproteobacteria bacterium]
MQKIPIYQSPEDGRLTAAMLADFHASGVIVLEDFVAAAACRALRERMQQMIDEFDPAEVKHVFSAVEQTQLGDSYFEESGDKIRFFFEQHAFNERGELIRPKQLSLNKVGHAMHDLDPVFDAFSRTPKLAAAVQSLGYLEPLILQSMYIFKPPHIGGEVICHQDSTYLYTEPESCTGFWFALEDATTENGCMHFIPGAHKEPLKKLQQRSADGKLVLTTLDATPWKNSETLATEAKTGTLVIFDGRAPHLSGPNLSDKSRHAYTLHVIEKGSHYPAENWLQRSADLPMRGFTH